MSRYRHRKRGSEYEVVSDSASVQASIRPLQEGDQAVVYLSDEGQFYVRLAAEFFDGRFEEVRTPLSSYTDEEIAAENYRRMVDHLGDPRIGVTVPCVGTEVSGITPESPPVPSKPPESPAAGGIPTYVKVGGPPSDWEHLRVFDLDTRREVEWVIEANTEEGWVLQPVLNEDGSGTVCTGNPKCPACPKVGHENHLRAERTEGRFEIRRVPSSSEEGDER